MKQELATTTAKKLRNDDRVTTAEVTENAKGVLVRATARDQMAARDLKGDLSAYPVYVEVVT